MKKLLATTALSLMSFGAIAADLPARSAAVAPAPVFVVAHAWSGFYVGVQGGYSWTDAVTVNRLGDGGFHRGSDPSADGWFGGVHVGYNWQLGNGVVIGLEADINGGDLRSSLTGTRTVAGGPLTDANNRHSAELKWFGSARARLGYSLGHLMPYVTGGLAFGEARYVFRHVGDTARLSDTSVGWTVGAGLEYMITPNWTARAEYRYTDYGSASGARFPNFPNERQTGEFKTHDVRIGISYKFGGASARPVVARY